MDGWMTHPAGSPRRGASILQTRVVRVRAFRARARRRRERMDKWTIDRSIDATIARRTIPRLALSRARAGTERTRERMDRILSSRAGSISRHSDDESGLNKTHTIPPPSKGRTGPDRTARPDERDAERARARGKKAGDTKHHRCVDDASRARGWMDGTFGCVELKPIRQGVHGEL